MCRAGWFALASAATLASAKALSTSAQTMRWGVIGCGKIASDFCNALAQSTRGQLNAVAARDLGRAQAFGQRFGAPLAFDSYDAILHSEDIDVIYLATLPNTHFDLASKAMRAGKPVLVEKPVTMSSQQARDLVTLSQKLGVFHMAGMWTRCFPAFKRARQLVAEGVIGTPQMVVADFGYDTSKGAPANVYDDGMGLDIGIYCIQAAQAFFPEQQVDDVQATGTLNGMADWTVSASLRFRPKGDLDPAETREVVPGVASVMYTGALNTPETTTVMGELGSISILRPAHTPTRIKVEINCDRDLPEVSHEEFALPASPRDTHWNYPFSEGLLYEIEAVHDALASGALECGDYTHAEAVDTLLVLERIRTQLGLPPLVPPSAPSGLPPLV